MTFRKYVVHNKEHSILYVKLVLKKVRGREACYKKNHAPFCSRKLSPHKWKGNEKLVFIRNGMASNVVDLELSGESLLAGLVGTLLERGIKKNQIVEESRKLKQKLGSGCTKERIRDDSLSSGISSLAPSINTLERKNPKVILKRIRRGSMMMIWMI